MGGFTLSVSSKNKGTLGVAGHVGVGHVHGHSGFVQDDSAGFAVVAAFLRDLLGANTHLKSIVGDPSRGTIGVETFGGGVGVTRVRRGITPWEAGFLERAVNEDGIYTQGIAVKTFGRIYGQGALEVPVAFQGAIALAVMDTLLKKAPGVLSVTEEKFPGKIDKMAGMVVDVQGIPVSFLLIINGTEGGIGPDEDLEGNTDLGAKGVLMDKLGMLDIPTIIVESKAFIPAMQDKIDDITFFVRAQRDVDNSYVARALVSTLEDLGIEYLFSDEALPVKEGHLQKATAAIADDIIRLGQELKEVDASADKVAIVAKLAQLISEDAGGVTFMSNSLHDKVRSAGMLAGTSAVLSTLAHQKYVDYHKIPFLEPIDVQNYQNIIVKALEKLATDKDGAGEELRERRARWEK